LYLVYVWLMVAINIAMTGLSLYYLFRMWREKRIIKIDTPVSIYIFTFLSAIFFTIAIAQPRQTQTAFLMQDVATLTYHFAFYQFLLLWCSMMVKVEPHTRRAFRFGALVALATVTANFIQEVVWLTTWPTMTIRDVHNVFRVILPVSELFLGFLCALLYMYGSQPVVVPTLHRQVFTMMTKLVVAGFLALALFAITFLFLSQPFVAGNVGAICSLYVLNDTAGTLRALLLFLILGDEIGGYLYTRGGQRGVRLGEDNRGVWRQLADDDDDYDEQDLPNGHELNDMNSNVILEAANAPETSLRRRRSRGEIHYSAQDVAVEGEQPKWVPITAEMLEEYRNDD